MTPTFLLVLFYCRSFPSSPVRGHGQTQFLCVNSHANYSVCIISCHLAQRRDLEHQQRQSECTHHMDEHMVTRYCVQIGLHAEGIEFAVETTVGRHGVEQSPFAVASKQCHGTGLGVVWLTKRFHLLTPKKRNQSSDSFFSLLWHKKMSRHVPVLIVVCLALLVLRAAAIQCNEVSSRSTCWNTIDDQGADCSWCADAAGTCGCRRSSAGCAAGVDCSSSSGGGGSSGLSDGETAGVVIAVLAVVCCCCLLVVAAVAVVVAVVVVKNRAS